MSVAHIVNRPSHEVGDKALSLCGVKHKVGVLWGDLPDDHPICRPCVDVALVGLTDLTDQRALAVRQGLLMLDVLTAVTPFTEMVDAQHAYNDKQEAKAIAKAEKKQAKKDKKAEKKAEALLEQMAGDAHLHPTDDEVDAFLDSLSADEKRRLVETVAQTVLAPEED